MSLLAFGKLMLRIGTTDKRDPVVVTRKAKAMGEILAERIVEERKHQGLSQQALVDRMAELGYPMNRITLSKIERGSTRARNVGLEEAFGLAAALSVPPTVLFLGLGYEDRVSVLPKMVVHPHLAAKWFRGLESPATSDRWAWKLHEWYRAAAPVRAYDALEVAQERMHQAWDRIRRAEYAGTQEEQRRARELEVKALKELVRILRKMKQGNVRAPRMPAEWRARMKQLGLEV